VDRNLDKLGLDYLDLTMMQTGMPDINWKKEELTFKSPPVHEVWKDMED